MRNRDESPGDEGARVQETEEQGGEGGTGRGPESVEGPSRGARAPGTHTREEMLRKDEEGAPVSPGSQTGPVVRRPTETLLTHGAWDRVLPRVLIQEL